MRQPSGPFVWGVLPILPARNQGRTFGLHPLMGSLRTLFDSDKRLAILPNIGPLIQPLTKAQYGNNSFPRPSWLFSHNDKQNTWQALGPEGSSIGWAGLMGDLVAAQNGRPAFTAISASGNAVWLAGNTIKQYQVNTSGAVAMGVNGSGQVYGSADVGAALHRIASSSRSSHPFDADVAAVARRSIDAEALLRAALRAPSDAAFGTPVSGNYNPPTTPSCVTSTR